MSTAPAHTRFTPEDLLTIPDGEQFELIDGQLVERNISFWSSFVSGRIQLYLSAHCNQHGLGWVLPEGTTYQCFSDDPELVRKPDASFIAASRMSMEQAMQRGHVRIAPDLAVEVMSPGDSAWDQDAKIELFLRAGTQLVWVINPFTRRIRAYRADGTGIIFGEKDVLRGEDVIPGFECPIHQLFVPPPGVSTAPSASVT